MAATPRSRSSSATPRRARKQCSVEDCVKVDAGGGFCVSHGGGKKCSFPGCEKGYQTGGFCRKHGGGARCQVPGCGKVDAGKGLCRGHGGGKRCQAQDCHKADVGGGLCTAHGGGKRCSEPGCTKIDQGGGKCRAHGGAKRCRHAEGCSQTARGASGLCPDHGGAKICSVANCRRLARTSADGTDSSLCSTCAKERRSATQTDSRLLFSQQQIVAASLASLANVAVSPPTSALDFCSSSAFDGRASAVTSAIAQSTRGSVTALIRSVSGCGGSLASGGGCSCSDDCHCHRVSIAAAALALSPANSPAKSAAVLALKRYVLAIELSTEQLSWLHSDAIVALLSAAVGVRSVHNAPACAPAASPSSSELSNDAAALPHEPLESHRQSSRSVTVVVRSDRTLDLSKVMAPLEHFGAVWRVLEQTERAWTHKEVVLHVPEMMCPGNCGNTVVTAVRAVLGVETATLAFGARHVVVRGHMSPTELCSAVEAVGFAPRVEAVTPLPRRFRFRVPELVSVAFAGKKLERVLQHVDGVECVVVHAEVAEVLVVAMLEDASALLHAALECGFAMVEAIETQSVRARRRRSVDSPLSLQALLLDDSDDASGHVCDITVCPRNDCEQYRATVAHTAALAIGWSVPGCAMTWGGECTCGELCKCKGCPTHNPDT